MCIYKYLGNVLVERKNINAFTHWDCTKWPPFYQQHIKMHLIYVCVLIFKFYQNCSWDSNSQTVSIVQVMAWCLTDIKHTPVPMVTKVSDAMYGITWAEYFKIYGMNTTQSTNPVSPFNCLLYMMLHVTMPGNNAITVSWFLAVLSACLWEQGTWLTTNYGHCGVFPSKRFTIMLPEYYFSLTMIKCIYI